MDPAFLLSTPVVLWCGWPFFRTRSALDRDAQPQHVYPHFAGYGRGIRLQCIRPVLPRLAAGKPQARGGGAAVIFEAASFIIVLVLLGQVLELRARAGTGEAIRALLGLAPKLAHRVSDGHEEDVALGVVRAGDVLRVKPGEKIPVDGVVLEGRSPGRRVDAHGRADSGGEDQRRQVGRRDFRMETGVC